MSFLSPPSIRKILSVPTQDKIDFRAACFCHKNIVDIGFVCSVCLSSVLVLNYYFPYILITPKQYSANPFLSVPHVGEFTLLSSVVHSMTTLLLEQSFRSKPCNVLIHHGRTDHLLRHGQPARLLYLVVPLIRDPMCHPWPIAQSRQVHHMVV